MHIAVEGSIGVGKSTLCDQLSRLLPGHKIVREPVIDNPYLTDYYKDPHRWAFSMQIELLSHRAQNLRTAMRSSEGVILDRSLAGDRVFALANLKMGYMSEREFLTYKRFFDLVLTTTQPLDLILYLKASPETIWQRVQKRGRESELSMDRDYFNTVCTEYDQAIAEGHHVLTRVVTVDWTEFRTVEQLVSELSTQGVTL